jgi:hypothetical protein
MIFVVLAGYRGEKAFLDHKTAPLSASRTVALLAVTSKLGRSRAHATDEVTTRSTLRVGLILIWPGRNSVLEIVSGQSHLRNAGVASIPPGGIIDA